MNPMQNKSDIRTWKYAGRAFLMVAIALTEAL